MGGGLMQLVAYGAQDIYLTGNPQITFFKVVYRRHTNFSVESIEQTFNGTPNFGKKVSATIARNGDLIHRVLLEVQLPELTAATAGGSPHGWFDHLGERLLKYIDIEIGGQRIDRHYGEWLHLWNQLTFRITKAGYLKMIGHTPQYKFQHLTAQHKNYTFLYSFGFVEIQVLLFLLLLFNIMKLRLTLSLKSYQT